MKIVNAVTRPTNFAECSYQTLPPSQPTPANKTLIKSALHKNSFFTCLDSEQITRFTNSCREHNFKPGQAVLREGGEGHNVYVIKSGAADVVNAKGNVVCRKGPGELFGEGSVLFNRSHSASICADEESPEELVCYVVSGKVFREYVLRSTNMLKLFKELEPKKDPTGEMSISMDDFIDSITDARNPDLPDTPAREAQFKARSMRISNTFKIFRESRVGGHKLTRNINFPEFCLFHQIMNRPDPEVDIAFAFMDRQRRGYIDRADFKQWVAAMSNEFDMESEFVRRFFPTQDKNIGIKEFSQFLVEFQKELGRQAFVVEASKSQDGDYVDGKQFVKLLKYSCGWRLPKGVIERLESMYEKDPVAAARHTARKAVESAAIMGSSPSETADATSASILATIESKSNKLEQRLFDYSDFCATQEAINGLPGICSLISRCSEVKGSELVSRSASGPPRPLVSRACVPSPYPLSLHARRSPPTTTRWRAAWSGAAWRPVLRPTSCSPCST